MSEKLPRTPLALYVKLYCKKKRDKNTQYHNNMIEATKSWLSLNEDEKQHFRDKLNECKEELKHKFADYLINVKPYLKKIPKKKILSSSNQDGKTADDVLNAEQTILSSSNQDGKTADDVLNAEQTLLDKNVNDLLTNMNKNSWIETFMETDIPEQGDSILEDCNLASMPEPEPPNVKSAKELFDITRSKDEQNKETWETLPPIKKQRYRRALLALKKDYINKYKIYLESLTSKQLFDYYNKINV